MIITRILINTNNIYREKDSAINVMVNGETKQGQSHRNKASSVFIHIISGDTTQSIFPLNEDGTWNLCMKSFDLQVGMEELAGGYVITLGTDQ